MRTPVKHVVAIAARSSDASDDQAPTLQRRRGLQELRMKLARETHLQRLTEAAELQEAKLGSD